MTHSRHALPAEYPDATVVRIADAAGSDAGPTPARRGALASVPTFLVVLGFVLVAAASCALTSATGSTAGAGTVLFIGPWS